MTQANAYQQYQQQSVNTMTPMEIILKLYGEAEKEITRAIYHIEHKNIAAANEAIIKTQTIVHTLRSALDDRFEVSKGLNSMYEYFFNRLLEANLKKDKVILEELLPMFGELKDTFSQISRQPKGL